MTNLAIVGELAEDGHAGAAASTTDDRRARARFACQLARAHGARRVDAHQAAMVELL